MNKKGIVICNTDLVKKQIDLAIEDLESLKFNTALLTDISEGSVWLDKYELIVNQLENILVLGRGE